MQIHMPFSDDYDSPILDQITVEQVLTTLEGEQLDLIRLWMSGSYTLGEIGQLLGDKYHEGKAHPPSNIRYHRGKIVQRLRARFGK